MKKKVISTLATAAIVSTTFTGTAFASTYTVQKGDSLYLIAQKYHSSIQELKTLNKLSSDLLQINQVLKISDEVAQPAPEPTVQVPAAIYTVIKGDSLSKIASQYGVSIADLKQWNNLNTDLILIGQTLKVSSVKVTSPSVPVVSTPKPSATTYVVKSGDSLGKIGYQFGMTAVDLKKQNNLSSDLIFVGQTLKVNSTSTPADLNSSIIQEAKKMIGTPYVWGGSTSTGVDCSGFVYYVHNQAGKTISRYSAAGYYDRSYYVDKPQAGDLVFFENTYKPGISHIGIYLGDNQFIQADETRGVTISSLNSTYYQQHFDSFKRFY